MVVDPVRISKFKVQLTVVKLPILAIFGSDNRSIPVS
ncbi:hypothetical protein ETSB_0827 [cyanobacterium endosymbiont of Epithemia turgida isolate EtSB Lake Yunoko]|nr:hypothetical protein ETSB_0827 [cyanobacterium endosymbiont of Epithemia turgida isolate EtSB Lake Yunoko]